jgi:hypothetical protein
MNDREHVQRSVWISPAALRVLREGYAEQATPVQQRQAEELKLEQRLADLVNQAYGLTPEEVELLWRSRSMAYMIERLDDFTSRIARSWTTQGGRLQHIVSGALAQELALSLL